MEVDKKTIIGTVLALLAGLALGWLLFGGQSSPDRDDATHHADHANESVWTCSMHPQIRQNEPGQCPICGMELIPLGSDDQADADPMSVTMSATAMQLANISTMKVGVAAPVKSLRLNGKVQADERLVYSQASHIAGRIERLAVNFTGEFVSRGQAIAYLYSPELVTAQEELFEALQVAATQPRLAEAAKEKLKNWKLTDKQIAQIIESGRIRDEFPVLADVSGYVTRRMVSKGDYLEAGSALYEISDFSRLWVLFDVYESDLPWVSKGDSISFTVASLPGTTFRSTISFVDPVVDPQTRVARARVEVKNSSNRLKPEMFAAGTVNAALGDGSEDVVVPKTAVLWTGKRSVVYVRAPNTPTVSFMMREVTLGPALGDGYVVEGGLEKGEEVVVNGTFTIDAAAQLAGKPSMMNRAGGAQPFDHNHMISLMGNGSAEAVVRASVPEQFSRQLTEVVSAYLVLKNALVADDASAAREAAKKTTAQLALVDMKLLSDHKVHMEWMDMLGAIQAGVSGIEASADIEAQRKAFIALSDAVIKAVGRFGVYRLTLYRQHCPMANSNTGADWLSTATEVENPYYGDAMLACGSVEQTFEPLK